MNIDFVIEVELEKLERRVRAVRKARRERRTVAEEMATIQSRHLYATFVDHALWGGTNDDEVWAVREAMRACYFAVRRHERCRRSLRVRCADLELLVCIPLVEIVPTATGVSFGAN